MRTSLPALFGIALGLAPLAAQAIIDSTMAEYTVLWEVGRGGPASAAEGLQLLRGGPKDRQTVTVTYFDINLAPAHWPGAQGVGKVIQLPRGRHRTEVVYWSRKRPDRFGQRDWVCPIQHARGIESETIVVTKFSYTRYYVRKCATDAMRPLELPSSLHPRPRGCSLQVERSSNRRSDAEEWQVPGGPRMARVYYHADFKREEADKFRRHKIPGLMRGKIEPVDKFYAELQGRCR